MQCREAFMKKYCLFCHKIYVKVKKKWGVGGRGGGSFWGRVGGFRRGMKVLTCCLLRQEENVVGDYFVSSPLL